MSEVAVVVELLVQPHGQFNGKDVSRYLRDYRVVMLRCGISEGLHVLSFNRAAMDGIQWSIHEIRQQYLTWTTFKEELRMTFWKTIGTGSDDPYAS